MGEREEVLQELLAEQNPEFFPLLWRRSESSSVNGGIEGGRHRTWGKTRFPTLSCFYADTLMEKLGKEWTFLPASRGKLHQQKGRWDASELCLVEMDRLCLSENMASVSQSLDYFPVCSLHSAASRRARASRQTGEHVARVRVTARARRWDRKTRAWLIVPTSDWIRPLRRPTYRPTHTLCKWPSLAEMPRAGL